MQNYKKACQLLEQAGGGGFAGPKTESLVAKAENALDVKFPPTYRQFLLELGCGGIDALEIYGLINDNFEKSSVPNGIWVTLQMRKSINLKHSYVIIGDGGDGSQYAIDTGNINHQGECPILHLSIDGEENVIVADSFGTYLLDSIKAVV
jgi:hypothetical protein